MTDLQQLEQQFHFRYPELYHRLYADGMLNWGTAGPDWISRQYPLLRQDPPLLLFANDFELMPLDDIRSQMEEFADPDYWMRIRPGLLFVPFAGNGAGDLYCFLVTEKTADDIPVVLFWHDANRASYLARNLQDFIFRTMLEAVTVVDTEDYGLLPTKGFKEDLQRFLRTHRPYLKERQWQRLTTVYNRESATKFILDEQELMALLEEEAGWTLWNGEFPYQQTS
ncbi:SMI1/KNR4 family protein [Niabella pedocola]|uniref:SMI1/KNR4 family protein n=1 Tax=Niabella pedocola TaxID=1752077 RepID=A0ABS8PXM9_9BACT|nr:SMI1/KNR4 family protein [Niabella pedocola]MCD2425806.1 SMI1/KNR4 family protein [Niabella pedocola]